MTSLFLLLITTGARPATIQKNPVFGGIVSHVIDGDTIRVRLRDGRMRTIDFWGVDAPELSQPFGPEAKALLEKLALNKPVVVEDYATCGDVYINLPGRQVLGNEQVAAGYSRYHVSGDSSYGGNEVADRY